MVSPKCSSKNPATCRYHGTRSSSYVQVLRDKVIVAHGVYSAAPTDWQAYENVRAAEIEYYATDEGQENLLVAIQKSEPGARRDQLLDMQSKSNDLRMKNEMHDSDQFGMWSKPAEKPKPVLPKPNRLGSGFNASGQNVLTLSEGETAYGTKFDFTWNAQSGLVSYGEVDSDGFEVMESQRILGRAATQQEALQHAQKWYEKSVVR